MATKSAQPEAEKADIEELLDYVDKTLDRTKVLYEQYFLGMQKQPPTQIHTDVERRLRDLQQLSIRNTGLRYRFATLQQKFGSYNSYWRRTLRQIENGTYIRNLQKISRQSAATGEEIPEEILAAMPKRMRDQVKRDREQALAIAKRRRVDGTVDEGLEDLGDDSAAIIGEAPEVVRQVPRGGAHVLDAGDGDLDIDAFFASVTSDDALKDDTQENARAYVEKPSAPAQHVAAAIGVGRRSSPSIPVANKVTPVAGVPLTRTTGPMPVQPPGTPPSRATGPVPVQPPQRATGPMPVQPPGTPPSLTTGPMPAQPPGVPPQRATGPMPAQPPGVPPQRATGPMPAQPPGVPPQRATGPMPAQPPGVPPQRATGPMPLPTDGSQRVTGPVPAMPGHRNPARPSTPPPLPPQRATGAIPSMQPTGPQPRPTTVPGAGVPAPGPRTGPVPAVPAPGPRTGPVPMVPAPGQSGSMPSQAGRGTGAIPRPGSAPAPSQVSKPNPIAPGSSTNRPAAVVDSLSGPFPRAAAPPVNPRQEPPRVTPTRPQQPAGPRPPPGMNDADVNALYAKYVKAKQAVGEEAGPGAYGKLLQTINAQAPKIMEQYKAKGVEFSVVVKDNQVVIKAKPKT